MERGTFHARYSLAKKDRHIFSTTHRLLDLTLCIASESDPDYLKPCQFSEFAVIDVVTREKAWFDMPLGVTPEVVTSMITSSFNASAFRVGHRLWFV